MKSVNRTFGKTGYRVEAGAKPQVSVKMNA